MSITDSMIDPHLLRADAFQYYSSDVFPTIQPRHWLTSHFAVGGWSPLNRLSGMLTAHMTQIAPHYGFTWHPHRGLEIYTWVLEGELYHEDTTGGKGVIKAGEVQRMFSGDYIEHQELNRTSERTRVIQIWYVADSKYRGLEAHYQQATRDSLPTRTIGSAKVTDIIGSDSPLEQHMTGRLTATTIPAGGSTTVEIPDKGEDLFLYITDGEGKTTHNERHQLGQYDVILARHTLEDLIIEAHDSQPLQYLSFYLPSFLPEA